MNEPQTAFRQLKNWLTTSNIKFREEGGALLIKNSEGTDVEIKITYGSPTSGDNTIEISGDRLVRKGVDVALNTYKGLLNQLGYHNFTSPVNRGASPLKETRRKSDFDLIVMRHQEFRRVSNPSDDKLKSCMPIIDIVCRKFYAANPWLFSELSMEISDLKTYASVWTCNYIGLYEDPESTSGELYSHLWQRLIDFRVNAMKTLEDSLFYPHQDLYIENVSHPATTSSVKTEANNPGRGGHAYSRKLRGYLQAMPKDQYVAALQDCANSVHPEVRTVARRKLKAAGVLE